MTETQKFCNSSIEFMQFLSLYKVVSENRSEKHKHFLFLVFLSRRITKKITQTEQNTDYFCIQY